MQNEKLAAIILVALIVVALFAYIVTNEDLFGNDLVGSEPEEILTIELSDCVDINYIGKFTDGTIFDSSYNDITNKTDGTPLNIFVSTNTSEPSPAEYYDYTNLINDYYVKGLIEGLVGLKEGDSVTIGPIPPEDAYGIYPKVGDNFTIFDSSYEKDIKFQFIDIITNASMPEEYIDYYGTGNTTLFVLRYDLYSLGEKMTKYPSWENATVVTKINDTKLWMYTSPPDDKITNFTWTSISNDGYSGIVFPDKSSSVTSINDTTIIVTHNPKKGSTITQSDYYYGYTYDYTVLDLTNESINVSYVDESTGDISYFDFDRTVTIVSNQSQNITYTYPSKVMEEMLSYLKTYYDPNLAFSVNEYADKYLIFEVQIEKIYKTS